MLALARSRVTESVCSHFSAILLSMISNSQQGRVTADRKIWEEI